MRSRRKRRWPCTNATGGTSIARPWTLASASSSSCSLTRLAGDGCLFEREHHRQVGNVLESLAADLLVENDCLFGGGTAIVLRHGEYHESVDIDFLVSSLTGYRALRQLV